MTPRKKKQATLDEFLSDAIRTEDGRAFLSDFMQRLDEPSVEHLLERLTAFVDRSDLFVLFERASTLEGALRLARGVVRFEWDADSDGPLLPFLLDVVKNGEVLR